MLISQSNFLLDEIPQYHPLTDTYVTWWKEQKIRCIEGYWQSGYWMPPKLYFYSNFSTIKKTRNKYDKAQTYGPPSLRDIEWKIFRDVTEAKGFSGFELDEKYSCIRDLINPDVEDWMLPPAAFTPTGERKIYVPAQEYMERQHPQNMGRPQYFNEAKNYILMGPRGFGKSYSIGSGVITHEFLFDAALEYGQMPVANIIVGAGHSNFSKGLLLKVSECMDMLPGSQKIGKYTYPCPFFKQTVGSLQPSKSLVAEYEKKIGKKWEKVGSRSFIKHVSYADNPYAGQGDRNTLMVYEEFGMFTNVLECHFAAESNMITNNMKFGVGIYLGTGGAMESGGTTGAREMFYHPDKYNALSFQDEYESRGNIGRFISAHLNRSEFKDAEGNTNMELAKKTLEEERKKEEQKKEGGTAFTKWVINNCVLPSEMFLMEESSLLPAVEATFRLQQLEKDKSYKLIEKVVELYFDSKALNGVNYKIDTNNKLKPLYEFPTIEKSREGAVIIYELPQLIDDKVPPGAYIIGHDPYKDNTTTGESNASIYVVKTSKYFSEIGHNEIVAEYVGRPYDGQNKVNDILLKLSLFYGNAEIFFENAVGNTRDYFEKMGRLDLLCHKPMEVFAKGASFHSQPSIEYGYPMSNQWVKAQGVSYLRDWLLEKRGEIDTQPIRNIDRIMSRGLLQEIALFNYDGNFDRVMGMMGCAIGLAKMNREIKDSLYQDTREDTSVDYSIITKNKKLFPNVSEYISTPETIF